MLHKGCIVELASVIYAASGLSFRFFRRALPVAAMVVRAGTSGRRRVKKKIKRKKSLGASNLKLQGRRRAVTEFNALLIQLGADALTLGREVAPACLERVLRLLDKRCIEESAKDKFRAAVFIGSGLTC